MTSLASPDRLLCAAELGGFSLLRSPDDFPPDRDLVFPVVDVSPSVPCTVCE